MPSMGPSARRSIHGVAKRATSAETCKVCGTRRAAIHMRYADGSPKRLRCRGCSHTWDAPYGEETKLPPEFATFDEWRAAVELDRLRSS